MLKMNNALVSIMVAVFIIFTVPVGGEEDSKNITVKVGIYYNPPLIWEDEMGDVHGFYFDILESIASEHDWELVYMNMSFSEGVSELERGGIDLFCAVAYSDARAELFDFSNETVLMNWGKIYTSRDLKMETLLDLDGRTIGVVKGDIYYSGENGIRTMIDSFGMNVTFEEVDEYSDVMNGIENGSLDAGVVSRLFGGTSGDNYHHITDQNIIFSPIRLKFAFSKNSTYGAIIRNDIDSGLRKMKDDPYSIYYSSLSENILRTPKKERVVFRLPEWTNIALIVLGAVISTLFISTIYFRFMVKKRTLELKEDIELRKQTQKRLEEEQKRIDDLLNLYPFPVFEINRDYRIIFLNAAGRLLFDVDGKDRNLSLRLQDLIGVESDILERLNISLINGKEISITFPDGTRAPSLLYSAPFFRGGIMEGARGFIIDIRDMKEKEKELEEQRQTAEFLLDLITHDIGNIHHAMKMSVDLLKTEIREGRKGSLVRILEEMTDRSVELADRVKLLVESSKRPVKFLSLDVEMLIKGSIETVKNYYPKRKVRFNTSVKDRGIRIEGESVTEQIFTNLYQNAIKHNPGERLTIDTEIWKESGKVMVRISDNGIGIPDNMKEILFQRIRKSGIGRGIGLSLVKVLTERIDGKISVEDRVKGDHTKGASFLLVFNSC